MCTVFAGTYPETTPDAKNKLEGQLLVFVNEMRLFNSSTRQQEIEARGLIARQCSDLTDRFREASRAAPKTRHWTTVRSLAGTTRPQSPMTRLLNSRLNQ